jgi:hypothetical protein
MRHVRAVYWVYLVVISLGIVYCTYLGLVGR